jgi:hypothetical protein
MGVSDCHVHPQRIGTHATRIVLRTFSGCKPLLLSFTQLLPSPAGPIMDFAGGRGELLGMLWNT